MNDATMNGRTFNPQMLKNKKLLIHLGCKIVNNLLSNLFSYSPTLNSLRVLRNLYDNNTLPKFAQVFYKMFKIYIYI